MNFAQLVLTGPTIGAKQIIKRTPATTQREMKLTAQELYDHLVKHGEMSTTNVATDFNINMNRAGTRLRWLRKNGLVTSRAEQRPDFKGAEQLIWTAVI